MNVVLDEGALIAIERGDRRVAMLIALARRNDAELTSVAPVIGQVWRDGSRQVRLARSIEMLDIRPVDLHGSKRAGELLAAVGGSDVVDALLVGIVGRDDQVLTSDPADINGLLAAAGVSATVVSV